MDTRSHLMVEGHFRRDRLKGVAVKCQMSSYRNPQRAHYPESHSGLLCACCVPAVLIQGLIGVARLGTTGEHTPTSDSAELIVTWGIVLHGDYLILQSPYTTKDTCPSSRASRHSCQGCSPTCFHVASAVVT